MRQRLNYRPDTSKRLAARLSCALLPLLLAACATAPPPRSTVVRTPVHAKSPAFAPQDVAIRETVLETALGQLGRPYRYGGGDGDGFDCSGLVQFVYAQAGVQLPRTAAQQSAQGAHISLDDAAPGDLVFFRIGGGTHVTIYVGDDRVVHAPSTGQEVRVTSITNDYWRDHLSEVVRVLR